MNIFLFNEKSSYISNNHIIFIFSGIFLSILNNDISKENQHNLKKDNIKKANGEDNKNNKTIIPNDIKPKEDESDKNNNQKIKINDFIDDENEDKEKKMDDKKDR